jgi:hypothetical protein
VFIGCGSGALAVIDPATPHQDHTDIPLKAHREAFELAAASGRILVNMADARQIAVIDRAGRQADRGVADASGGGKLSDADRPQRRFRDRRVPARGHD